MSNYLCFHKNDKIITTNNNSYKYDYLIVAVGSENNDFGISGVKENCYFLKSIDDLNKLTAIQKTNNNIINNKMNEINSNNELMTQKIYMDYYKTNVNKNLINFLKTVSLIVFIVFIVVIVYVNYSLKKST